MSSATMSAHDAIEIVARSVAARCACFTAYLWDETPEIGSDDWGLITERARRLLQPFSPTQKDHTEAYRVLADKAKAEL